MKKLRKLNVWRIFQAALCFFFLLLKVFKKNIKKSILFIDLIKNLDFKKLSYDLTFHCYLFGPKFSSAEERFEAREKVRETLKESYGPELENKAEISIREVRDISVDNLQYCASIRWTSENNLEPPQKRSRISE